MDTGTTLTVRLGVMDASEEDNGICMTLVIRLRAIKGLITWENFSPADQVEKVPIT